MDEFKEIEELSEEELLKTTGDFDVSEKLQNDDFQAILDNFCKFCERNGIPMALVVQSDRTSEEDSVSCGHIIREYGGGLKKSNLIAGISSVIQNRDDPNTAAIHIYAILNSFEESRQYCIQRLEEGKSVNEIIDETVEKAELEAEMDDSINTDDDSNNIIH